MPAFVVPAVATTPMTSSRSRILTQRGTECRAGQAVIFGRHGQRADTEHVERLPHRGVGILAQRDKRTEGRIGLAPVSGGVVGHHEGREVPG